MSIAYLDGRHFGRAITAGADWVRHTRQHLNHINVFPVADGDTGNNMALSLAATADAVRFQDRAHLSEVLERVAEASVLGAKGNSGLILAHWFLGLQRAVGACDRIDSDGLAQALARATDTVYRAIEEPVEGTILTVMRAVSDRATELQSRRLDITAFFQEILAAAEAALARTPDMLDVLRDAHVVDAGAQGFVNFLKGADRAIRGRPAPEFAAESNDDAPAYAALHQEAPTHQFCTELIVRGSGFEVDALKQRFHRFGDSMLVATTGKRFKLHIHTNHPEDLIAEAAKLGTIEERKVDDMQRQSLERDEAPVPPLVPLDQQPSTVAILADSVADLPADVARDHQIERVPLQLLINDEVILDQFDLGTQEIYQRIFDGHLSAGTSQPPPGSFVSALRRIRPDREAIVLTMSSVLSGTYKSALSGARLAEQPRVEIFDSRTGSLAEGMMAICASRLARAGADFDTVLTWLERWRDATQIVFTVRTLEYLRRGGRISAMQGALGGLLGLRPILGVRDGGFVSLAKERGDDRAHRKLMQIATKPLRQGQKIRVGLAESTTSDRLDEIESILRADYEVIDFLRTNITAVIGAHIGPGAYGVAIQAVRDDDPLL